MASYTMQLRKVINLYTREEVENWFKDYRLEDYLLPDQLETLEHSNLFSKDKLAKKIVDHFFMREIGFETPALFRHYAKMTMNEIMERYLPLIYTQAIQYDPLINVDFTETYTHEHEGEGSSNSNSSGLSVASDTPQGQINKDEILSGKYASNTSAAENEGTATSNTKDKDNYTRHLTGNQGITASYQAMIMQYRATVASYTEEIINELNSLFMGLY